MKLLRQRTKTQPQARTTKRYTWATSQCKCVMTRWKSGLRILHPSRHTIWLKIHHVRGTPRGSVSSSLGMKMTRILTRCWSVSWQKSCRGASWRCSVRQLASGTSSWTLWHPIILQWAQLSQCKMAIKQIPMNCWIIFLLLTLLKTIMLKY